MRGGFSVTGSKLKNAFELQRFAPNARLQGVIDASHARVAARELGDDELEWVAGGKQTLPDQSGQPRP
jgi:hypothetical protein